MAEENLVQPEDIDGLPVGEAGLPEVSAQIHYRERGFQKRKSLKDRRENVGPNELFENDFAITSGVYDFFGLNESAGADEIDKVIEGELKDDRTYELFIDDVVAGRGLSQSVREQMLADTDLKTKFLKWVKLDKRSAVDKRQLADDMREFKESLARHAGASAGNSVVNSLALSRDRRSFVLITSKLTNGKTGNIFSGRQKELYLGWKKGMLAKDVYHKELTKLYNETIETSDDEELKKMWREEQQADYETEFYEKFALAGEEVVKGETPVEPDDIEVVNGQVSSVASGSGFDISFNNSGIAKVDTDYCSMSVSVYKKSDTGDFVYYVEDPFSNSGRIGPIVSPKDLPELLDSRQIDAYLTKSIKNPLVQKEFSDLPDENIIRLAKKIVGAGSERRNFRLVGEDREVLDNLVYLLTNDKSELYPTLRDKILKLNFYTEREDNAQRLRRDLLNKRAKSLDEVVGQ